MVSFTGSNFFSALGHFTSSALREQRQPDQIHELCFFRKTLIKLARPGLIILGIAGLMLIIISITYTYEDYWMRLVAFVSFKMWTC